MLKEGFFRNFVFGVEDSLVSTVGFLSGIAVASVERSALLLSSIVLIFVEAFSMGVGSYLSDESVRQIRFRGRARGSRSLVGAVVMFLSYLLTGFVVIIPYWLWPVGDAFPKSITVSLVALFLLGAFSARASGLPIMRRGARMMLIGGFAIGLGVVVAMVVRPGV